MAFFSSLHWSWQISCSAGVSSSTTWAQALPSHPPAAARTRSDRPRRWGAPAPRRRPARGRSPGRSRALEPPRSRKSRQGARCISPDGRILEEKRRNRRNSLEVLNWDVKAHWRHELEIKCWLPPTDFKNLHQKKRNVVECPHTFQQKGGNNCVKRFLSLKFCCHGRLTLLCKTLPFHNLWHHAKTMLESSPWVPYKHVCFNSRFNWDSDYITLTAYFISRICSWGPLLGLPSVDPLRIPWFKSFFLWNGN